MIPLTPSLNAVRPRLRAWRLIAALAASMARGGAAAALLLLAAALVAVPVAASAAALPPQLDAPLPSVVRICVQPYMPFVLQSVRGVRSRRRAARVTRR